MFGYLWKGPAAFNQQFWINQAQFMAFTIAASVFVSFKVNKAWFQRHHWIWTVIKVDFMTHKGGKLL